MKLTINGTTYSEITTEEDLISSMDLLKPEYRATIKLNRGIQFYMLATGRMDQKEGECWQIEVRRGSPKDHYEAEFEVNRDVLLQCFMSYLGNDDHWQYNIVPWLPSQPKKWLTKRMLGACFIAIIALTGAILWELNII